MKKIEIDTEMLQKSINTIESELNNILTSADSTYDGIKALDAMWNGPANDEFNKQFEADYQRLKEICKEIKEYNNRMTDAKTQYDKGEDAVWSVVSAIRL